MVQQSQFGGDADENPNIHLARFCELCDALKVNGVSEDAFRLRLFSFSLRDKAKAWLQSMSASSITTWDMLSKAFLKKYFPPGKIAKLTNEIMSFSQRDSESLYEAWERYKDLQRQCPQHGIPNWLLIQTFYYGLDQSLKNTIDIAAGGSLMWKTIEEALALLEEMATNNYQWSSERATAQRSDGVFEVDALSMINVKFDALTTQVDRLNMNAIGMKSTGCDLCGGGHQTLECLSYVQDVAVEQLNFVNNSNNFNPRPVGNPYPTTYSPNWRNHPNFSWSNQQHPNQISSQNSRPPLGFQQRMQTPPNPPQPQKSNLELMMENFLTAQKKQDEAIQQLTSKVDQLAATHNKMLENQIAQQAANSSNRNNGKLPSQPKTNPKEQCQVITLRNGKQVEPQVCKVEPK